MTRLRSHIARSIAAGVLAVIVQGCATTAPAPKPQPADTLSGIASWYGEEFAGRTTANGEIFDPQTLTAAHRTLPFGTILEVRNPANSQKVTVRINDRGPFVGNRVIDLSWAAAKQIGLVEPGIGPVEIRIVKLGAGDREPPVPFDVVVKEPPKVADAPPAEPTTPPDVPFPIPGTAAKSGDVVVDRVDVVEERGGRPTRRVVAPDGQTFETVAVDETAPAASAPAPPRPQTTTSAARQERRETPSRQQFYVQAGAFASEENATALQQRLAALGHRAQVDRGDLFRVRIGPFARREDAVAERTRLEGNGLSALIVTE